MCDQLLHAYRNSVTMPMGAVFSSSPRSTAPHGCWSTERCARFAARREYHLIKSLVNDRATLAAARDAGLIAAAPIGVAATSTSTPDGEGTATLHKEEVLQRSKRTRRVKTDACKAKERRKLEEKVAKRAAAAKAEKERQAVEAAVAASKKAAGVLIEKVYTVQYDSSGCPDCPFTTDVLCA